MSDRCFVDTILVYAHDRGAGIRRPILSALDLEQRFGVSFWDALILQAAKTADVTALYSEDLSHGQLYDAVQVVNPFA